MIIKRSQLSDSEIDALDHLLVLAKQHDGGLPAIYKHLLVIGRDEPSHLLYYTEESQPTLIGFLSFYFFKHDSCEISVVVHPNYRHQGIAHQLLKMVYSTYLNRLPLQTLLLSSPFLKDKAWQTRHTMTLHHVEYHLKRAHLPPENVAHPRLSVRLATVQDIPFLCALDSACFQEHDPSMRERFQVLLTEPTYVVLVAEKHGEMIGKAHLRFDSEEEAVLSDLAIYPAHQHQGFGGELLSCTINHAIEQGCHIIELDVDTDNQAILQLYLQHGFTIDNQIYFYKKTDHAQ